MLDALRAQSYPLELMEIVIADGGSKDRTREFIKTYQTEYPEQKLSWLTIQSALSPPLV